MTACAANRPKGIKKTCRFDTAGFFRIPTKLLGSIFGVQQVVSLFAAGSTQILFVELLDIGVLVRKTQGFAGIFRIKTLHALFKRYLRGGRADRRR